MANSNLNRYDFLNLNFNTVKNKKALFNDWYRRLMNVCLEMFEYENLPKTIPKDDLEFKLFSCGYVTIGKDDKGDLRAFMGALGGEPDADYLPTLSVVANPALKFNKTFEIGKDCIILKNDKMFNGLHTLIQKYSALLTTFEISFYWGGVNGRTQRLFATSNKDIAEDIKKVYQMLEDGNELRAISDKPLFELLKSFEVSSANNTVSALKSFIEVRQYIIASFYIDVGLNANYNMKRESLNENEINSDNDILVPFVDNMHESRINGWNEVNDMFGTNIKVKLSSRWEDIRKMLLYRLEEQKKEAKAEEPTNEDAVKTEPEDVKDDAGGEVNET